MQQQIYIGNIYKITKEKIHYEPKKVINNSGIEALICGEDYGFVPPSIQVGDTQCELYKEQVLLVKISDELDLISKFVEILEIKDNDVIVDEENVILSLPFGLNNLFVDESSIQPYFHNTKKGLVKILKNNK